MIVILNDTKKASIKMINLVFLYLQDFIIIFQECAMMYMHTVGWRSISGHTSALYSVHVRWFVLMDYYRCIITCRYPIKLFTTNVIHFLLNVTVWQKSMNTFYLFVIFDAQDFVMFWQLIHYTFPEGVSQCFMGW